jgi:hypothetical protein
MPKNAAPKFWDLTPVNGEYDSYVPVIVDPPPDVDPPPPPGDLNRVEFAEIPEIIFIKGYTETIDLGIFMIDPGNRWTPGDLFNQNNWQSRLDVTLEGAIPAGLTFGQRSMKLTFDGSLGETQSGLCRLKVNNTYSRWFEISVLKPLLTWGNNASGAPPSTHGHFTPPTQAEVADVPSTHVMSFQQLFRNYWQPNQKNCFLIMGGAEYYNRTGDSWNGMTNAFPANGSVYLVGEPNNRPILRFNPKVSGAGYTLGLYPKFGKQFYLKNFQVYGNVELAVNVKGVVIGCGLVWAPGDMDQAVCWNVKLSQTAQEPWKVQSPDTLDYLDMIGFIINTHGYHCSGSHMQYHLASSVSPPNDQNFEFTSQNRVMVNINNCRFTGSRTGQTLKSDNDCTMRNSYLGPNEDWTNPAYAYTLTSQVPCQIHSGLRNLIYNNKIEHLYTDASGQAWTIFLQRRNATAGGETKPPYFGESVLSDEKSYTNNRILGEVYHGTTTYNDYPVKDVPWWNAAHFRPFTDIYNPFLSQAWFAYNQVVNIDGKSMFPTANPGKAIAHRQACSMPHKGRKAFDSSHDPLGVPDNWVNTVASSWVNNTFTGYTTPLHLDEAWESIYESHYGPWKFTGNGVQTVFPMPGIVVPATPQQASWLVYFDGVLVSHTIDNTGYEPIPGFSTVSAAADSITFTTPPGNGVEVEVSWLLPYGARGYYGAEAVSPYEPSGMSIFSNEAANQINAEIPNEFVLSYDFPPTYPLRTIVNAMPYNSAVTYPSPTLTYDMVRDVNTTTGTSDWIMNYGTRFYWKGDTAWFFGKGQFNTRAKLLKYEAIKDQWSQVGTTPPQPEPENSGHSYNHACVDHLGNKLYFREYNDNRLKIFDINTGVWTISAPMPESLIISAVALAWHPHLFDDYTVRVRERTTNFNGGVVLYAPNKLWAYNPRTDAWSLIHSNNGVRYDGQYELSAIYVRGLDAVVFGGGQQGTGKVWRIKHATAVPEQLPTAPMNFGANQISGLMMDDPDANGVLLLEKGVGAGNRAWRLFSKDNDFTGVTWEQIGDHPFNSNTPSAHWVACTNEVDGVIMAICRPTGVTNPTVRIWKPTKGFIPRIYNY